MHVMECSGHNMIQALVGVVLGPEEALNILHPFKIGYRNTARNHSAPSYRDSHLLVIPLRKWGLEQGLFQKDLAKVIGVTR